MSDSNTQAFKDWMIADGKSANTVSNYVSGVNTVSGHCGKDVFAISDLAELTRLYGLYGPGGEHADIGGTNSNNVRVGLRQWFVFQWQLQRAAPEPIPDYADRRVKKMLTRGDLADKAWLWSLIHLLVKKFPKADHYPVNLDPTDIRIGVKSLDDKTGGKDRTNGRVAFRIRWSKDGFTCDARDQKNHLDLLRSQGVPEQISSRQQVDDAEVNAWLDSVIDVVSLEALPLDGEGRMPSAYETKDVRNDGVVGAADRDGFCKLPLNQILFGPPGTGKTYNTINEALRILAPEFLAERCNDDARDELKMAFDRLVADERIRFVTFHQSFSYEDFVEGLRARTDEVTGQLRYDVVDGVFKSLCEAAASKVTQHAEAPSEVGQRRVWKMSLGNTLGDDASIFQECINGGYALLGYGGGINFAGCTSRQQVQARFAEEGVVPGNPGTDYGITSVTAFVAKMKVGDLIVVSDGNFKFRAVGEVTGDYQFKPHSEFDADYSQMRPVRWLRHYQPSLPHSELLNAQFSQMTLYELRAPTLNQEKLERLLGASASEGSAENDARVLIIDEINRGSVSRIFGELITLIEESKRAGRPEALPVVLPYSQTRFTVPDNLYIIGTMNTADRSLAGLDIALRRRFVFKEMPPRPELLDDVTVAGVNVGQLLRVMNHRIEVLLDRDHCLGHAYFMPLADDSTIDRLASIFRNQILPLLQEYFFEDWQRIGWVLNDHRKAAGDRFIQQKSVQAIELFGQDVGEGLADGVWELNEDAFERQEAYLGIIDASRLAVEPEVKRQASHGDLVLRELASGTIELLHNGKLKQPVLPVLRELASDAGIDIRNANGNDLNTRTLGGKLITHLSNGG